MRTIRIASWNCWGGCVPGPHANHIVDFIANLAHTHDVVHLQEVHRSTTPLEQRFVFPRLAKDEPAATDGELANRVAAQLTRSHRVFFTPHFVTTALHDREATTLPIYFGNLCLVKKHLVLLQHHRGFGYGRGELNTEDETTGRGQPAARAADVLTIAYGKHHLTILGKHGIWSKRGKSDIPARRAQNLGWKNLVQSHWRGIQVPAYRQPPLVSIGDFNYQSCNQVLHEFAAKTELFGGGGAILNHHYNITDTRTTYYAKSVREADFAIVSPQLLPLVRSFTANADVPSDHAVLSLELHL